MTDNAPAGTGPERPAGGPRLFRLALALTLASSALAVLLNDGPCNDVASVYARQVREFAGGHWTGAFFHMTPPLVIVLAGLLAKLAIPPFAALKLVSGAFFVAGLWPLRRLLRRMLPAGQVGWGCLIYAVSPLVLRAATKGTLETAKVFLLLWVVIGLLEYAETRARRWVLVAAAGTAGLALARGEGALFVPLTVAGLWALPWLAGRARGDGAAWRPARVLRDTVVFAVVVAALCAPQALYVQRAFGYPALDSRQAWKLQAVLAKAGLCPPPTLALPTDRYPERDDAGGPDRRSLGNNLRAAFKGLDTALAILACLGIAALLARRGWRTADSVCLAVIAWNMAVFLANGFVTKRYIAPTQPFLLAWVVGGVAVLRTRVLDRLHRRLFAVAAGLFVVICLWDGLSDVRHALRHPLNRPREFGQWVETHRAELVKAHPVALVSNPDPGFNEYHDGRQPIIATTRPQYAFWATGDWVCIPNEVQLPNDALVALLRDKSADLVVVDRDFFRSCPDFTADPALFEKMAEEPGADGYKVYRFLGLSK